MRYKILALWLIGWAGHVHAQQPFYKNYQIGDGLPSNYIYSIFQDKQGYIWASSDVGVSRFDGQSFTNFNTSQGLPDNEVFSMCEDHAGRLWFATLNGKAGFYYKGVLYNENNTPLLLQCNLKGLVIKLFELADGRIAFCGSYKTILIDLDRQQVETRNTEKGIILAWADQSNQIWGAGTYMGQILPEGFRPLSPMPRLTQTIQGITSGDTLIVCSQRSLYFFNRHSGQLLHTLTGLEEGNLYIFIRIIGQKLWAGTRNGAIVYDYPSLSNPKVYLSGRSVSSVLRDREGGLWFSTFEEGIVYAPNPEISRYDLSDGLLHQRIICLSRDSRQRLWIGSEGSAYSIFDGRKIESKVIFQKNVTNKNIRNIRHLPSGETLVVSKMGTLILRDKQQKLFVQRGTDIIIDDHGTFWAALNAVYEIPAAAAAQKMLPFSGPLDIPDTESLYGIFSAQRLKGIKVEKMEFDAEKRLWAGTHNGLYAIDSQSVEVRALPYSIKDLDFDPLTKTLWVLSESNGVFGLKNGLVVDSIGISNQFGPVICRDLCIDNSGDLWIGTASGLFQVQRAEGKLRLTNFGGVLGLGWDKINAVEVIADRVYIGKDDGLLAVSKSLLAQPSHSPPALLKSVRINNRVQSPDADGFIRMQYGEGSLNLEFEGLSFREPQYLRYRYRLNGLDSIWRETANEALEFASLRPGKYHFEVYTVNGAGEICASPTTVHIEVMPPFWLRGWFYGLLAIVAGGILFLYIQWRENRLRKGYEIERKFIENSREKAELQRKIADLKMLALRLQMNPHFIFNALNTIKGYYGQEKLVEANAFIGKFARLLRLNLDYSDAPIPLDQEIELLRIYLQLSQIRYPDKICFEISVAPDIHIMETMIPSMLLQPFVENAVIHGLAPKKGPGDIRVNFALSGSEIIATVSDTGVGREASAQRRLHNPHKPLATQITLERLQLLRGNNNETPALHIRDLYEGGTAAGTEVVLHIPFQTMSQQHDQGHHH